MLFFFFFSESTHFGVWGGWVGLGWVGFGGRGGLDKKEGKKKLKSPLAIAAIVVATVVAAGGDGGSSAKKKTLAAATKQKGGGMQKINAISPIVDASGEKILVLPSASVERFGVSHMQDFCGRILPILVKMIRVY